jgi:hypothetical protein
MNAMIPLSAASGSRDHKLDRSPGRDESHAGSNTFDRVLVQPKPAGTTQLFHPPLKDAPHHEEVIDFQERMPSTVMAIEPITCVETSKAIQP